MSKEIVFELLTSINQLHKQLTVTPGIQSVIPQVSGNGQDRFNTFVTDGELAKVTRKLFLDGHHARAIEEAYKFLNNLVKKQTGISSDGSALMKQAFSANSPVLKLNAGTNQSEKDEQLGYMEIFSGCMTGIRNPRAHEHEWEDSEMRALQLLALANHLVERVRLSTK